MNAIHKETAAELPVTTYHEFQNLLQGAMFYDAICWPQLKQADWLWQNYAFDNGGAHYMSRRSNAKLKTVFVYPPIPIRNRDWCAYEDGEEESRRYGWGRTEREAIAD